MTTPGTSAWMSANGHPGYGEAFAGRVWERMQRTGESMFMAKASELDEPTSAQRDENRLTEADRRRIDNGLRGVIGHVETCALRRIAAHSIGCSIVGTRVSVNPGIPLFAGTPRRHGWVDTVTDVRL